MNRMNNYYQAPRRRPMRPSDAGCSDETPGLLATLPPDKKAAVVDKAEAIIRSIASGDRAYLIRQDLLKILKQNI